LPGTLLQPACAQQAASLLQNCTVAVPTTLLQMEESSDPRAEMMSREISYLSRSQDAELPARYASPVVSAAYLEQQAVDFAATRGIDLKELPPLGNLDDLKPRLRAMIDRYFDSDQGSRNPLKHQLTLWQTERYLDLVKEAEPKASPKAVYQVMSQNLALLALQDRAAAEITFGEHGVRHLIGHNIKVSESLLDQMQVQGAEVTAKDRLLMHQAMLLHDLGYAADNVRGAMAREGIKGQDSGHPLLAGRYVRERMQNDSDPIHQLFSAEEMQLMHRCVMYHDQDRNGQAGIDLTLKPRLTAEERGSNLETITRLADNSHAFDDKVSDILYRHPAALKSMRLIKAADEIGDAEARSQIQADLKSDLAARADLSADDKAALQMAVGYMNASEYEFSSRRLIGSKPFLEVGADGKVTVHVTQSPIHGALAQVGGQAERKILPGYIADLTGSKPAVTGATTRVRGDQVDFELTRADGLNDYQKALSTEVLGDVSFRRWAVADGMRSNTQKALQELLKQAPQLDDTALTRQAEIYLDSPGSGRNQLIGGLEQRLSQIQAERSQALHQQLQRAPA